MRATVLVRPKDGILDPEGEAVRGSLRKLGFPVGGARVGRLVDLDVDAETPEEARVEVERMCRELLANPLVESFEIEIAGEPGEQEPEGPGEREHEAAVDGGGSGEDG